MVLYLFKRYTHARICLEYLLQQVAHCLTDVPVEAWLVQTYLLVDGLRVLGVEGCLAGHYLHDEDAETPDVDGEGMARTEYDLWCQVLRSATVRRCLPARRLDHLRKSEVHKLDVPAVTHREHDVLWLQVPVHYLFIMEILKSLKCLPGIEGHIARDLLVHLFDLVEKCAAFHIFELQVEVLLILK